MKNTNIEWAHHTFNPWEGCTKTGPGCDNCYAEARNLRFNSGDNWGPGAPRRRTSVQNWKQPLKWNRQAEKEGVRYRVFCASIADVFDKEVPADWLVDLLDLIRQTPHLDWLLVTKRIGRVNTCISTSLRISAERKNFDLNNWLVRWAFGDAPKNVWLGATIVNQPEADRDIIKLISTPAAIRFLSMEPLLGPVDFAGMWIPFEDPAMHFNVLDMIDWVIVGGESGKNARPMQLDWVRTIREQCIATETAFFFKQWGEFSPNWFCDEYGNYNGGPIWMDPVGKKKAGRTLDGVVWDQYPEAGTNE